MKKIQLSNFQIEAVLSKLSTFKQKDVEIDALTMYKLVKNIQILEDVVKPYLEVKHSLIMKYGKEDRDGNISIEPQSDKFPEYSKEIQPIGAELTEVQLHTINLDAFKDIKISMDDMIALEIMIKDGED